VMATTTLLAEWRFSLPCHQLFALESTQRA
jgi:hypothetical protein